MAIIRYTSQGRAIADRDALREARSIDTSGGESYCYSTLNVIIAIRLCIADGTYNADDLFFYMEGEQVTVDEYGAMRGDWSDLQAEMCEEILRHAVRKRKEERESIFRHIQASHCAVFVRNDGSIVIHEMLGPRDLEYFMESVHRDGYVIDWNTNIFARYGEYYVMYIGEKSNIHAHHQEYLHNNIDRIMR